MLHKAHSLS